MKKNAEFKITNKFIESRISLFLLMLMSCILIFNDLSKPGLPSYDDCTKAERAWEMKETGDYITPQYAGKPNFDHPPFYLWFVSFSFSLLGKTEFAARLFSAICALLAVFVAYKLGEELKSRTVGWFTGFFLATSYMFLKLARRIQTDIPFMLFSTLALLFFIKGYKQLEDDKSSNKPWLNFILYGLFVGISGLTKSVFVIFPLLSPFIYLILFKKLNKKVFLYYTAGAAIGVITTGWWYIYEYLKYKEVFVEQFFQQFVGGHMGGMSNLGKFGPAGYLYEILRHFWLWLPLTIFAIYLIIKKKWFHKNSLSIIVGIHIFFPFVLLSFFGDKSIRYIMFLFIPLLYITAAVIMENIKKETVVKTYKGAVIIITILSAYMIIQPINTNRFKNYDYVMLKEMIDDGKLKIGKRAIYHFGEDYGLNRQPLLFYTGHDLANTLNSEIEVMQTLQKTKKFLLLMPKQSMNEYFNSNFRIIRHLKTKYVLRPKLHIKRSSKND